MWFKMAALKVMTATSVLLVFLMCGRTTSASHSTAPSTDPHCADPNGRLCAKCDAGFFLGPTACQECYPAACQVGTEYKAQECDGVFNVYCKTCTTIPCPNGQYQSAACTTTKDRVCKACGCAANQYKNGIGGCADGVGSSNFDCQPCVTCGTGFYMATPCDADTNTQCERCTVGCTTGFYQTKACSATADRTCAACKPSCPRGKYKTGPCGGTTDHICADCTAKCDSGKYITDACLFDTNTVCGVCTPCEPDVTFEVAPCDGVNDRECAACSTETCPAGFYQSSACNVTSDRICSACGCPLGSYKTSTSGTCEGTSNFDCADCKTCEAGTQYVGVACSSTTDATCLTCDAACADGQYEATPCDGVRNRKCAACTTCAPGFEEKSPCTPRFNRVCIKKKTPGKSSSKSKFLNTCKNKFAQRIRLGLRCQQTLCRNVPSYRRLNDCSRVLFGNKAQSMQPRAG